MDKDHYLRSHNIINNNNLDLSHLCNTNKDQVISLIKPMLEMDPETRPAAKDIPDKVSRLFLTFQLKNQQTTIDEASVTSSKARTELSITEKEQIRATQERSKAAKKAKKAEVTSELAAVEELAAKKEQVDKPVKDEPKEQKEKRKGILTSLTKQFSKRPAKAKEEADSKTPKALKRKNTSPPELQTPLKMTAEQASSQRVLTGTTADGILASTSKAIPELSIPEKVNAIIMFAESDKHMYSFNLSTKELCGMQEFPEYDSWFTTVVSGKHIYFIQYQKVHQLEYSDSAAEWKEMSSTIEEHGEDPPAAVLNGSGFMYVCGSGSYSADSSRFVERYDAALDRWDRMCDMNTARIHHCVVATEDHIYCIGGYDEQDDQLQSIERFDERLNIWVFVESAPRSIVWATAAVVKNRIYVTDPKYEGILCYDIQNDSWSKINSTIKWPFRKDYVVKLLAVDEELYIIGTIRDSKGKYKDVMYLLEPETKQMTLIEEFEYTDINLHACLAVKL